MNQHSNAPQIITLGHIESQLVGKQVESDFGNMRDFEQYMGGFAANFAIACARLGLHCAPISRTGHDSFGEQAKHVLQNSGVNVEHVQSIVGTHSILCQVAKQQDGSLNRQTQLASSLLALDERDVYPQTIQSTQALVVSAQQFISNQRAIRKAIVSAKEAHVNIFLAFDLPLNKSPQEQTISQFQEILAGLLPLVDVIIGHQNEFLALSGADSLYTALKEFRQLSDAKIICITETGASFWVDGDIPTDYQLVPHHTGFYLTLKNPLAAAEGYIAGFIYAWQKQYSTEDALMFANAMYSLTASRERGYQDLPSLKECQTFLNAYQSEDEHLNMQAFNHCHYVTTRMKQHSNQPIIGIHFSSQTECQELLSDGLLQAVGVDAQSYVIAHQKSFYAADLNANRYVLNTQQQDFSEFNTWPSARRLCCEITTHPDDPYTTRMAQEMALGKLIKQCRQQQREMIIDISLSKGQHVTTKTLGSIIERFYAAGIYPDWWQLPLGRDERSYAYLEQIIEQNDPHCYGYVLKCPFNTIGQLQTAFSHTQSTQWCKGFVIPEAVWRNPIEQWQNNSIANHTLSNMIATFYTEALKCWKEYHSNVNTVIDEHTLVEN